ncbi:unnamed protein product [Coregonus sp. 'balchen']|nr:unnamed protein product [Coregonus sp. 'balchen']
MAPRFGDIRLCERYGATEGNVGFINYIGKVGAIGKEFFLRKLFSPCALIKYDTEREKPVRDSRGFCVEIPKARELAFSSSFSRKSFPGRG